MRARIAKQLIAGIGISAITLCGSAVIARADPPPDKKQHEKQAQAKPAQAKPAQAQAKPSQPQGHQAAQRAPEHPAPQAQQHAQRPAQQARGEATPHSEPAQQVRKDEARQQPPRPQQHAAPAAERAQPARASREQPKEIRGGAPQRQEVRAVPQPIPPPPARVSVPAPGPVNSTVRRVRLAPQAQQAVITQQQRRITQYSADLSQGRRVVEQQAVELQRQHRTAQYRFMQGYVSGLHQQEVALRDYRYYDYNGDPYFYTPADYRYYRGDQYYETNEYGIALLRQALNNGYREGRLAGMADREDGWRPSYESSYAYRDANYGYNGYYLDRGTYNYYFREGFRRGYDDGYNSSYRYGRYSNGTGSLLDSILNAVLRVQRLG
jgi:chemotaxis protein histidine kinase CheA